MEFLKEVLGEELFNQVTEKINAYNDNEANKDKQIKVGNLGSGEYVDKRKYETLNEQLTGKQTELDAANGLIEQLKKDTKGNEEVQKKFSEYEAETAKLQAELAETKLKAAVKVALLSEKAVDVDYLTYKLNEKLKEKGETLELDENDNIKGWADRLSALKTQYPNMFETAAGSDGYKVVGNNRLKEGEGRNSLSREKLLKMSYADRSKLYEENPELYSAAMKN